MNNDSLLCQHDNSHVREFADRDWLSNGNPLELPTMGS